VVLGVADGAAVVVGLVLGVVVLGVVVLGVVVVGVLEDGVPVVGPAVVGDVGSLVVVPVVGSVVVGSLGVFVVVPVAPGDVVPGVDVELLGPPVGAAHGVAGVHVVLHGVPGCSGFPTGSEGRAVDRDVPSDRPSGGLEELAEPTDPGGSDWAVLCDPIGTKNQAPASATTTAASTPSFRTGRRRRLWRAPILSAPNFRA
jgi:hypothetical protein